MKFRLHAIEVVLCGVAAINRAVACVNVAVSRQRRPPPPGLNVRCERTERARALAIERVNTLKRTQCLVMLIIYSQYAKSGKRSGSIEGI